MGFLRNCKVFCEVSYKKSCVLIHLLKFIRETVRQNQTNMAGSGIQEGNKELKSSQSGKHQFVEFFIESYINENLFEGDSCNDFDNFKLNFREVWIPGENHETKIKS